MIEDGTMKLLLPLVALVASLGLLLAGWSAGTVAYL
jgi:hypothetical protein